MSTRTILLAVVALGLIIGVDTIEAVDPPADVNCEDDGTSGSPLTASIVKAYLIYVSYPGNPDSIVAVAANSTIANLSNWLNFASNGKQQFNLSVLRRLDDPNKAWRMSTMPDPPLATEVAPAPILRCPNGALCNPSTCPVEQCTWRCNRPWEYRTVGGIPGCYWPENYTGSGHHRMGHYELANRDLVRRIYNHYRAAYPTGPSVFAGIDRLFIVHYASPLASPLTRCSPNYICPSGVGALGIHLMVLNSISSNGLGTTQMLLPEGSEILEDPDDRLDLAIAHEYSHSLTLQHTPNSGNPPPIPPPSYGLPLCFDTSTGNWNPAPAPYVNVGRYDALRGIGPSDERSYGGLLGLHPWQMKLQGWLGDSTITSDIEGFHIPDVHGTNPLKTPKVYRLSIPTANRVMNAAQSFLLVNHQQSGLDQKYGGHGLLIWHLLRPGDAENFQGRFTDTAWDLESAQGKFTSWSPFGNPTGLPDPVSGQDFLEASWCWAGSVNDFFNDGQPLYPGDPTLVRTDFTPETNPNTNLYTTADFLSGFPPQSVRTSIAVENIHKDPYSTDMVADIYFTPTQRVLFPNGGESVVAGQPLAATWKKRSLAGISSVDVTLLKGGSPVWQASGQPNTGSCQIGGIGGVGSDYRIQVTSHDPLTSAHDESDANFTVWGIQTPSIQETISQWCVGSTQWIKFDITWATSDPTGGTNSPDSLLIYTPGSCTGTTTRKATVTPGTATVTHNVVWQGACASTGTWWYTISSTKAGSGTHRVICRPRVVTCGSCSPCQPDPCELE